MAGIWDTNVIDLVAQDANGDVAVIMVEERAWGSDPDQSEQLKMKMSLYASWILDGDLLGQYPMVVGKPVRIQIDCIDEPTPEIADLIEFARQALLQYEVAVKVNVRA